MPASGGTFLPGTEHVHLGFHFSQQFRQCRLPSLANQELKDLCHQFLISSASILELERHDFVVVQPMWCDESCLFLIWLEHRDLVVSRENVYEGKHPMYGSGINYLIYPMYEKTILQTCVIHVGVIDANSPFLTLFWNDHHICQPVRILIFSYKPNCGPAFFTCVPTWSTRLAFYLWKIIFGKVEAATYFIFILKGKQNKKEKP